MSVLTKPTKNDVYHFMDNLRRRNPGEPEFHQAVQEFVEVIIPFIDQHPYYLDFALLERLTEPDKVILFRVTWIDDAGKIQTNKGYRVQFSNAIGPYKGGLRFHSSVNLGILKFLGFEQIFKNSLTGLPMGGGKGGSDFDPKGKSDGEIMRFCQAFMQGLFRHIGPDTDVPAGDIGVGGREIGYLFGQYKKMANQHNGVLTGKGLPLGGSLIRPEATGYGCAYFINEMLGLRNDTLEGKRCLISGSGNVAQFAAEKVLQLGGTVLTLSDSSGMVYDENGINEEKLEWVKDLKNNRRGRIKEFAEHFQLTYIPDSKPWKVPCDIAMPCATQNELLGEDAAILVKNGCLAVGEGANMPCDLDAVETFQKAKILYAPGKASNAGGVATSGLEMSQNSLRLSWTRQEVDNKLQEIMKMIHESCQEYGRVSKDRIDYVKGANIAGFVKVADAVIAQGVV